MIVQFDECKILEVKNPYCLFDFNKIKILSKWLYCAWI